MPNVQSWEVSNELWSRVEPLLPAREPREGHKQKFQRKPGGGRKSIAPRAIFAPPGSPNTVPVNFVSSLAGGSTADVLSASLLPGTVGIFQVVLHLNSSLPTNTDTTHTIAQDIYVSNVVTFAVSGN